jgi:hypothetical protein
VERELTVVERGVVDFMLADPGLPAGDALRAQVPHLRVIDGMFSMPTFLHLTVTPGVPPADCPDGKVPVDALVVSSSGERTGDFILLWTTGGYLSDLQLTWVTNEPPNGFQAPDRLRRWDGETGRVWDPRAG